MIERLQEKGHFDWDKSDQELFNDVRVEYEQAFFMAKTMQTVMGEMTDAFASLISNNLNIVMKFLAAVTIILTVPMIIASIYGMNVGLPGDSLGHMFLVILAASAVAVLVVTVWFRRRGWLSFHWRQEQQPRSHGPAGS
jgi:magnesium transporter